MLSFAVAQICFIKAFGFEPLKPGIALLVLSAFIYILNLLLPNIDEVPIKIGFPVYSLFLGTMGWRALAKMGQGFVEKLAGLGAVLFMISDACIGINLFYQKLDHSQEIIMSTYYLAQYLITLYGAKLINIERKEKEE